MRSSMRRIGFAMAMLAALAETAPGAEVVQSARKIPLVQSTDVLVVGGTSAAPAASAFGMKSRPSAFSPFRATKPMPGLTSRESNV